MFIYMSLLKTLGVLFANSTIRLLVKKKKKKVKKSEQIYLTTNESKLHNTGSTTNKTLTLKTQIPRPKAQCLDLSKQLFC